MNPDCRVLLPGAYSGDVGRLRKGRGTVFWRLTSHEFYKSGGEGRKLLTMVHTSLLGNTGLKVAGRGMRLLLFSVG